MDLKGDITVALETRQPLSFRDQRKAWERKKWQTITDQAAEFNRTMKIETNLSKFELFLTQLEELTTTEDFTQVRKRNLIMPFTLNLIRESYAILNSSMSKLITYNNSQIRLEKFALRISYNDFKLIYSTLMYQLEQLSASRADQSPQTEELPLEVMLTELSESKSSQINTSADQLMITEESKTSNDEYITTDFEKFEVANQGLQLVNN